MFKLKALYEFIKEEEMKNDLTETVTFNDLYKSKNRWIEMRRQGDREKIADNLFVLINNSYGPLGGHPSVKDLDAIISGKLTYWEAIDRDADPEADSVLFGRKTDYGIKISGMGHDGVKNNRSALIAKLVEMLRRPGYWIEASGRVEEILYKKGVPYLDSKQEVDVLFDDVKWLDNRGQYKRKLRPGGVIKETVFGRPVLRGN